MWITQPMEITKDGVATGRWRLTARSDEDGGGPYGDNSHDHGTPEEAQECEKCREYCAGWTGRMPDHKPEKHSLIGKTLFKAIYKLKAIDDESQRFIVADNEEQAKKEIESYGVDYFTIDMIQDDISIAVL